MVDEQPSRSTGTKEFYDTLWNKEWRGLPSIGPSCRTRYRLMLRLFERHGLHGKILDIGCGSGDFLGLLKADRRNTLYGMDVSPAALAIAAQKDFVHKTFVGDLIRREDIPEEMFDAIVASEVLEHIDDYELAIRNISGILRDGGHLLLTVPYRQKYWTAHDDFSGHVRRFEPGELEAALRETGFFVTTSYSWGNFIYNLYYHFFLRRQDPKAVMKDTQSRSKRIVGTLLYHAFKIDDLLAFGHQGRRLVVLAQKGAHKRRDSDLHRSG